MNAAILEALLNEEEGTALDFRQEQYPFVGATDGEKFELLKDILAFANSWRRTTAYILIGVQDVKGGRSQPVGNPHISTMSAYSNLSTRKQIGRLSLAMKRSRLTARRSG